MNVHRRDRAKLKQSIYDHSIDDDHSRISSIVEENKGQPLDHITERPKRSFDDMISGSDDVETSLSVGLSTSVLLKRPKDAVSAWPYSPLQWPVLEPKPASSIEGLDLELRLGVL
ncbi:hypothetical protein F3Y22_tig00112249pilonHSYRG00186 [Hibiscus syriacus]|uniref:Uncharacterized protein n=2 Tax=Hibiscus syriacus TaxID=106335 RepID=A0A6A2X304_HIBSY|nr:hypothetical protein F3Y22_tig00112249pilonHSYRG00186 [Hibiscus syriacus]